MRRRFAMRLRRPGFRGTWTPMVTPEHSARRLLLVGVLSAVLCAVLFFVAVRTPFGQWAEDLVLFGRPPDDARAVELAWNALGTLNLAIAAVATLGLAAAALVSGRAVLAVGVIVAIVGANLTTQVLKEAVLERPNLIGTAAYAYGNSFPSGHVTLATSLALAALLVAPRRVRSLVAVAGAAYVGIIGASTLAAGWHRLGDAVGAILIALAWCSLVAATVVASRGSMPRRSWRAGSSRLVTDLLIGGALVAFIVGVAVLAFAWVGNAVAGDLQPGPAPGAFTVALAVMVGGALLAFGALLWALRGVTLEARAIAPESSA